MTTIRYIRVSSIDQNTDRQHEALPDTDETFEEKASAATANRPQLQEMLGFIRKGDHVYVASIDRLARNIFDLHRIVTRIVDQDAGITFVKEGLTFENGTSNPMKELMLTMLGGFAQFERALIKERQAEGIAAAKAKGKRFGRPAKLTDKQKQDIRDKRKAGANPTRLAEEYGVSRASIYNVVDGRRDK